MGYIIVLESEEKLDQQFWKSSYTKGCSIGPLVHYFVTMSYVSDVVQPFIVTHAFLRVKAAK